MSKEMFVKKVEYFGTQVPKYSKKTVSEVRDILRDYINAGMSYMDISRRKNILISEILEVQFNEVVHGELELR